MPRYYPPRFLFRRYEILRHVKSGSIFLEIGPGSFELTLALLLFFKKGDLIDFSLDVAKKFVELPYSLNQRLNLILADFSNTSPLKTKYDCIVACEVMEHIQHDDDFLALIYKSLIPGGQLIISVPARMRYWSIHDEIVGHVRRYEKESVSNLLSKQGFSNIQVISYGYPFINWLRWLRIGLAKWQYKQKRQWNKKIQTQKSGIIQTSQLVNMLGFVCNQYTVLPLCWLSSKYIHKNWSNGYVIIAEKTL